VAKRCCSGSGRWEGPAVLRVNLQGRGGVRIALQRRKGSKSYLGASSLKRWSWRRRGSGARRLRRWKRRLGGSGSSSAARALRGTYTRGRRIKGWLYPWRPTAGKNRAHMRRLTGGEKAVVVRTQGRGRLHFVHAPLRGGKMGTGDTHGRSGRTAATHSRTRLAVAAGKAAVSDYGNERFCPRTDVLACFPDC
jgi:hypothetical protein